MIRLYIPGLSVVLNTGCRPVDLYGSPAIHLNRHGQYCRHVRCVDQHLWSKTLHMYTEHRISPRRIPRPFDYVRDHIYVRICMRRYYAFSTIVLSIKNCFKFGTTYYIIIICTISNKLKRDNFLQCLGEKNGSVFYSSTPLVFLHEENEQYDNLWHVMHNVYCS